MNLINHPNKILIVHDTSIEDTTDAVLQYLLDHDRYSVYFAHESLIKGEVHSFPHHNIQDIDYVVVKTTSFDSLDECALKSLCDHDDMFCQHSGTVVRSFAELIILCDGFDPLKWMKKCSDFALLDRFVILSEFVV